MPTMAMKSRVFRVGFAKLRNTIRDVLPVKPFANLTLRPIVATFVFLPFFMICPFCVWLFP